MKNGVLLIAHNSDEIDYGLMAIISGTLAKKNLKVPVSLITDKWTLNWIKESNLEDTAENLFDKIIITDKPNTANTRILHDGFDSKTVPFVNTNRSKVWELTPYERTLLIDTDFLIFSDKLSNYWDCESDIMLAESMNEIVGDRKGILDEKISETGIHLFWATTVMFTKNQQSKFFFDIVDYVRSNYKLFGDIYGFSSKNYRNDISFSIAKHMMDGFTTTKENCLPPILTVLDKDLLIDVDNDKLTFLLDKPLDCGSFWTVASRGVDVHLMNKQSILRYKNSFLN
jgi:hypothetical protein